MDCTPSPKICQEIPENQAVSLSQPGRVVDMAGTPCPQMLENQAVSLPRLGGIPNVACIPWPKMPEIRLRPCRGPDASRSWPAHRVPKIA
ncbi:Hypothetical predicted protein [Olea europaea subsp. europaea]|uniref:Uncharacterized protein n=1 Tax=Olea europaea subsp. europaea TaxID=158383 RepID=A0A8S0V1W9_OLEEU|nr:Hypothetical predicted protein [Olea europaea subsp. europaea]